MQPELVMKRCEAKVRGLKRYWSGKPCPRGHMAFRLTGAGTCVECIKLRKKTPQSKEWYRDWFEKNREKRKEQMRVYQLSYRGIQRKKRLAREYDMTVEQYEAMSSAQGYRCAICRTEEADRKLYVDHCHTETHVRGLLCLTCNFMLGYAYDNPEILIAGARYLQTTKRKAA